MVVEASGKYLIPGLMDMHVHLFNNVSRRPPSTWAFPLFIVNGVTGVREMWTEFASMPTVEQWRRDVSDGQLLAPRVLAAGAIVNGPGSWHPNMPEVTTPAEARRFVRETVQAGLDFVKVYSLLAPEVYHAIAEEARDAGLQVAGHTPLQVHALEAARAGQRTNEHLQQVREACTQIEDGFIEERQQFYSRSHETDEEVAFLDEQVHRTAEAYDEQICRAVARALAEAGQWQIPTLVNERRWFLGITRERDDDARLAHLPPDERAAWRQLYDEGVEMYTGDSLSLQRGWEATLKVVDVLNHEGAGILVGTDFGNPFIFPGASVHEEMEMLVGAGLTPLQALQAATLDPARYLGVTDLLGTVAEGKLADLVLLDANPLELITNTQRIHAVMLNGQLLQRSDLDALIIELVSTNGKTE
ncbi:MAG: amidohydrolase family protein [Acidobacteria bacterium]|nr:amidohydrolase family protein [Acidobacteriota bacterium]